MKRLVIVIAVLVLLISGGVVYYLNQQNKNSNNETAMVEEKGTFTTIKAEQAKKMMDEGMVTIVDVRAKSEYEAGHVKNAILIPNESIGDSEPMELTDKDATILLYCRTGVRAGQAAQKLADMGYKNVYSFGGIVDWPYEIEK